MTTHIATLKPEDNHMEEVLSKDAFKRGQLLLELQDWQGASVIFQNILAQNILHIDLDLPQVYASLGFAHFKQDNYLGAIQDLREAIRLNASYADAYYYLGLCHKKIGDIQEAIKAFQMSILQSPNRSNAYFNLGNLFYDSGHPPKATRYFKEAINQNPEVPAYHFMLANSLDWNNDIKEVISELEITRRLSPALADIHWFLGLALCRTENYENAIASFRKAIAIDPTPLKYHSSLEDALIQISDL